MEPASREFLYELLRTPSPTGSEQRIQRKIHDRFKGVAHAMEPDVHGNLILSLNPKAKQKIMLAGHCDQIGFLVKYELAKAPATIPSTIPGVFLSDDGTKLSAVDTTDWMKYSMSVEQARKLPRSPSFSS